MLSTDQFFLKNMIGSDKSYIEKYTHNYDIDILLSIILKFESYYNIGAVLELNTISLLNLITSIFYLIYIIFFCSL